MIIIRDETMNLSYSFVPTKEGYCEALAKIRAIVGAGHVAGGDLSRVEYYFGHL